LFLVFFFVGWGWGVCGGAVVFFVGWVCFVYCGGFVGGVVVVVFFWGVFVGGKGRGGGVLVCCFSSQPARRCPRSVAFATQANDRLVPLRVRLPTVSVILPLYEATTFLRDGHWKLGGAFRSASPTSCSTSVPDRGPGSRVKIATHSVEPSRAVHRVVVAYLPGLGPSPSHFLICTGLAAGS